MLKATKNRILRIAFPAIIIASLAIGATTAFGAYDSNLTYSTCSLGIYPYNPTGTVVGPLDAQWFNLFEGVNNSNCTSHLQYPNQYTPQPPLTGQNPLANKAGIENIKAPEARHNHIYHNATLEDSFYYKSFMDRFQVILEQDALTNTDKYNLVCYTPKEPAHGGGFIETPGCNGNIASEWGGTNVSYDSSSGVITWKYATSGSGRPMMWGNNPGLGTSNGLIQASVKLISKNNPQDIWSGTTTSRVLIRDLAFKKNTGDATNSPSCENDGKSNSSYDYVGNWCTLPAPNYTGVEGTLNDSSTGDKTYYWYRIGVVGSVWRKAEACNSIDINPTGPFMENELPKTINITPHTTGGLELDYKWTASNSGGFISFDNIAYNGSPYFETSTSTLVNKLKALTGPITLTVQGVKKTDHSKAFTGQCQKQITINNQPPGAVCTGITLTPNYVNAPGSTPYIATVTFSDGKSYNTTVNWTGTNGTFTKPANETSMSGASPNLYQYTNTFDTQSTTASVTAKVTSVQGATNSAICQEGVTWHEKPENPKCVAVNLSPNSLTAPGSTPLTATVTYDDGQSHNTELTWSQTNGGFSMDAVQQHQSSQAFTNTYTTANNSGSVTARVTKVLDPNVDIGDCGKNVSISQGQGNPYCVDLIVTPDELNASGATNMSAKAVFSDGNTYDTTVQWTGSNGTYSNSTTQTHDSGANFTNTFNITDDEDPASASVTVIDVPDADADNGPNCSNGRSVYTPPEKDKCEDIDIYKNIAGEYCVDVTGGYDGKFTWIFDGVKQSPTYSCVDIPPGTDWRVYATDEPNNKDCQDEGKTDKRPPRVSKGVRSPYRGGSYVRVISIPSNQTLIDYQIQFNADTHSKTTATIVDDISDGTIDGTTRPVDTGDGHITYVSGSQSIDRPACSKFITENCYTGDIGNGGVTLVKVTGTVTITYKGQVNDTAITPEICKLGKVCQEKYINSAKIGYEIFDEDDNVIDTGRLTSNETLVQIFCQYILTRAAGDIYLETDLNAGVDIRMCSKYTSTTGVLVVPGEPTPPELGKTGLPAEIMTLSHEICTAGQSGSIPEALKPYYGQTVAPNLSSQICEVKLQPGTSWQQKTIVNDIEENKTRISRWEPDYIGDVTMSSVKLDSMYEDKQVYHVKDGDLTVDQPYILSDGEGAKTFIVENGDLYINKNIVYDMCLPDRQPCTVNDVASLAFIVLNGSVYVDPDVTEMSGVFFVQEGERTDSGRLYSLNNESSYNQLVVYGSVYGDIEPLFLNRLFAGDPTLEEAGIVVRFDERIILNTPPGLRDVMSYSSTEVAR